ncbi:Hypothetical protein R9X50_00296300 [Acrodontium crateriforme]|uniref:Uncharacterized protein n=1 Tax=Acrodontium crateriforme TaxID=150365 RepID=A0AAQ3M3H9_9PEZI|nr:Hypothetical protein R9X50_00296300 [Acrodontium crateriforme]
MRLTCKAAADSCERMFIERFIHTRYCLLSDEDHMRDTFRVVEHPVFGPAIRKFRIIVTPFVGLSQSNWEQKDGDRHSLTTIFCQLRRLGIVPGIYVEEWERERMPPKLHQIYNLHVRNVSSTKGGMSTVIAALALSGLHVETFVANLPGALTFVASSSTPWYLDRRNAGYLRDALRDVKVLGLELCIDGIEEHDAPFFQLLSKLPQLEVLELALLQSFFRPQTHDFSALFRQDFPTLQKFEFLDLPRDCRALVKFAMRHENKKLKRLVVRHGTSPECNAVITSAPSLQISMPNIPRGSGRAPLQLLVESYKCHIEMNGFIFGTYGDHYNY